LAAVVLALAIGSASGIQIATNQFAGTASIITFETGSTAMPGIPGLSFSGGDATFSSYGFGSQIFGNLNGSTYLDVYFTQPQQAVGAYIINDSPFGGVTGVIEVAYDQNNNVLESVSTNFPALGAPRRFLGIGEVVLIRTAHPSSSVCKQPGL
jgi:DNA-binding beta-propeller fold protein YncE